MYDSHWLNLEGGNEGEIWRSKLWSQSAEEAPSDQKAPPYAWGKGACRAGGIPSVNEVYPEPKKTRPKSRKHWTYQKDCQFRRVLNYIFRSQNLVQLIQPHH